VDRADGPTLFAEPGLDNDLKQDLRDDFPLLVPLLRVVEYRGSAAERHAPPPPPLAVTPSAVPVRVFASATTGTTGSTPQGGDG
jgi:hypothetical protein